MRNNKSEYWVVYIIECSNNTLYTGITKDLHRRIQEHSSNKGAKYTKGKGPFKVIHTESYSNRSDATKREIEIKKMDKKAKLSLAIQPLDNQKI